MNIHESNANSSWEDDLFLFLQSERVEEMDSTKILFLTWMDNVVVNAEEMDQKAVVMMEAAVRKLIPLMVVIRSIVGNVFPEIIRVRV